MTPADLSREELLILVEDRWGSATEFDMRYARWQAALRVAARASAEEQTAFAALNRATITWRARYEEPKVIAARAIAECAWERAHTKLRACDRRADRLHQQMMELVTCPTSS